jgi:Na+-transporting methylmalonyl-CoA/oxaloacetate decarboxylase gamma subunit
MSQLTFGLTMLVVGMGGTLLTLWLLTLLIRGLTALFPADSGKPETRKD